MKMKKLLVVIAVAVAVAQGSALAQRASAVDPADAAAASAANSAADIAASAADHNNADGLVPAEVEDWVESILADSSIGPAIRKILNTIEAPLIGPYQWNGYLPCDSSEPNCGNNLLKYATKSNISFTACVAYDQLASIGYVFNPPPHGSSGCIKPYFKPGVTAYSFIGYERCSGGFFCFGGWHGPFPVGPLSYSECFGMMVASGWRPPPQRSGPQPPLGTCLPPLNPPPY